MTQLKEALLEIVLTAFEKGERQMEE